LEDIVINSPEQAIARLIEGNDVYRNSKNNNADISQSLREHTAKNEQRPYAVILTCSDSRVPPEHIFSAGIGDLFVIRTAGNVVGYFDIGSVEYGVRYLGAKVIVVMGHTMCGAVAAALEGMQFAGRIADIVNEIQPVINGAAGTIEAENLNIAHSYKKVLESPIVRELMDSNKIDVVQAKYDLHTGKVDFFTIGKGE
jgi:carbonic anhydrase